MTRDIIFDYIDQEANRQQHGIELIASENFTSKAVMEAQGSVLTNKYAEGYPGRRYYGGCEFVDKVEVEAIERAKKLFNAKFANVQPHSGSQANTVAYEVIAEPGDTILGMNLNDGGHLTHGSPVNFSGRKYNFVSYGVDENERIDYEDVRQKAIDNQPKVIVAGYSAYSRNIDFKVFREIADEVGAYLMVDMAHFAGLVAAGLHQNPLDYADIVTSTTHKTLRGPRGGIILSNNENLFRKIDSRVFPGNQGGPLEHVIAAKAVAFGEALEPSFKNYMQAVLDNIQAMAEVFENSPIRMVSGGSDNHLLLLDVTGFTYKGETMNGADAEALLDEVGLTVNKNTIPNETLSPTKGSGIRIGTAAITTRGFDQEDSKLVAQAIIDILANPEDETVRAQVRKLVDELTEKNPLYK